MILLEQGEPTRYIPCSFYNDRDGKRIRMAYIVSIPRVGDFIRIYDKANQESFRGVVTMAEHVFQDGSEKILRYAVFVTEVVV